MLQTGLTISFIITKLIEAEQYLSELIAEENFNVENNIDPNDELNCHIFELFHIIQSLKSRVIRNILDDTTINLYYKLERSVGVGTSTDIIFDPYYVMMFSESISTSTDLSLYALDSTVVHNTGNETIDGVKTFLQSPIVPTATAGNQAINLDQLNAFSLGYTFSNGINLSGDDVKLGGLLTQPTGINLNTNDFFFLGQGNTSYEFTPNYLGLHVNPDSNTLSEFLLTPSQTYWNLTLDNKVNAIIFNGNSGMFVTDSFLNKGLQYTSNYSANFTARSLIDKGYADSTYAPASGGGYVTTVSGTSNRITSTGGTTPIIDISATFENLLAKIANPLSQFASTTSSQLASVISDETGSGSLVFSNSPTLVTPSLGTPSVLVGTNITGTASGLTAGSVTNGVYTTTLNTLGDARWLQLGSVAGGDLSGTYPNPTINTINSITKSYYDPTSSIQTQLNTKIGLTALSATSPIFYNSTTGVISSQAATSSQNGYLTSANWSAFNNKQSQLSGTGFVKVSGTTITYDNSTYLTTATAGSTYLTIASASSTYMPLSGGTFTGDVQQTISPVNANSLITKSYVDNAITGLTWKKEVRIGTTANITLSGTQTIDGISAVVNDRVLVKNQTTTSQNGIWVVASGSWTRALDADTTDEIVGATVMVRLGTINKDTQWTNTNSDEPVIGTDPITFAQIAGSGTYTNGTGISLTGNVFSLNLTYTDARYGLLSNPLSQFASTTSSQLAGIISDETGSGALVFGTSPTLITPNLGTPSILVGTNITGTASSLTSGTVSDIGNLTGDITSINRATTLATVNTNTGSYGSASSVATFTVNAKGLTTAAGNTAIQITESQVTNLVSDLAGKQSTITFGIGVQTALGVSIGNAGAPVLFNGAGGTPSSMTLTNATGLPYTSLTGSIPTWNQNTTGSAATLTTTRSIWGQSFNGSADITGALSGATTITASSLITAGNISLTGNLSAASWTIAGLQSKTVAATLTNTSTATSGTVTTLVANSYGRPTFASTNTGVTVTNAATLYIEGTPIAGTNTTLTNAWSLYIGAGLAYFGAGIRSPGDINPGVDNTYDMGSFGRWREMFSVTFTGTTFNVNGALVYKPVTQGTAITGILGNIASGSSVYSVSAAQLKTYAGYYTSGDTPVFSGNVLSYRAITSATTVLTTDYTINITSGTFTQPLPTTTLSTGQTIQIKNSGVGVIIVTGTSIDGQTSIILNQYDNLTLQYTGTSGTYIIL